MSFYAADAVLVDSLGNVLDADRGAIRVAFERVFEANPELHADVPAVVQVGDWVMIHSIVPTWPMPDGSRGKAEWVELYQVVDGKIRRAQQCAARSSFASLDAHPAAQTPDGPWPVGRTARLKGRSTGLG
jgi:hypothetical protein